MGVNDLWQILEPAKEYVPLQNLKGKTLAVDMSLWVCEAQTVKGMIGTVIKPHLRNLFFRISCLTLMDVRLVFVAEGNAPKLKADTMNKRNEARHGLSKKQGSFTVRTKRSHFKSVLKECCELLDCLGIPWVCAAGEAEAMCAYLNENGYVDGCITNDGDAFLYGAQTVYRNFTMNTKDPHVDCYKMSTINSRLGLDRDALIGFAILLGCDYLPKGVPGVGKEQALRLIEAMNGQSVLQRFKFWKLEFDGFTTHDPTVEKKAHCSVCQHPGLTSEHVHKGCQLCATVRCCSLHGDEHLCPCDWHEAEQKRKSNMVENNIKKKARACKHFPFEEVIREFLISKDQLIQRIQWKRPKLLLLQNFALDKMEWPRHYTCEKVLMLLSHHDMMERKLGRIDPCHLQPISIVKTRIRNGIPCFEILWGKTEHYVTSSDQFEDSQKTVTTIEDQVSFQAAYPDMTALFYRQNTEKKKMQKSKSKRTEKVAPLPDEITHLLAEMNLQSSHGSGIATGSEPVQKSVRKRMNPSNTHQHRSSVSFCTEGSQECQEFSEKSNKITQPGVKHTAEIIKSDSESLSLKELENEHGTGALSPSASMIVAELDLSGIDWTQSFSTPRSDRTPTTPAETSEQVHPLINEKCCVPVYYISKLKEDKARKENAAALKQDPLQKNVAELSKKDASMLPDLYDLSLKDRILLKNSHQFLSLHQSDPNSGGTLPYSFNYKNDAPFQGKLTNESTFSNKERFSGCDLSETQCIQQEKKEIYISDPTTIQHVRPLTEVENQNLTCSREHVVGTSDPAIYSHRASKTDSSSLRLKKNKTVKPHRMKHKNGTTSTFQKKSVCRKLSSSSEDSDIENTRIIQKCGFTFRAIDNIVMSPSISNQSQTCAQRTKSRTAINRIDNTKVATGHIQLKVISSFDAEKTEQTQLTHKQRETFSKSSADLPRLELSAVQNLKQLSDNEDSIIVISDSSLPLSEGLDL
ncbi:flap endonuclease GEN homolog 1 [Stegostoma tigrinum]|uniref:flap endonuclease GEN homolog 1 n=1 Tax=Stegostoma tigrinum TaxID=3053191 RepID=UPI002870A169|nr:flap endonuclease GEN homolog 1 [Stegostoma tigrinum]XP_048387361.2 flap endonuclease GEN homolog 1 [Stegostoma tigrinum]XP_048387362.2 flap endonuclease GEN homolog 1 [Stegostoma tigrinum]XP_048387363.2 flap endonuclease GEN homolog 1 [Stegostoma tigrinum]XP_048387364.2 flap endonuclease GEN homolog 1 [Stegostoma tigrinum]